MNRTPLFGAGPFRCVELDRRDLPCLQRFFEANPEYFFAVNGAPPGVSAAHDEFEFELPAEWPFGKKWLLGFFDGGGEMVAMSGTISDLFAGGVWHIGLYIVATSMHGTGKARAMYHALESWMRSSGARWVRLGVVAGNARAERFWEALGYRELRRRLGVQMGSKTNDLRVMVKPLDGGHFEEYLMSVPRDRPESP